MSSKLETNYSLFHKSYIYGNIEVLVISGVGVGESRVGANEFNHHYHSSLS